MLEISKPGKTINQSDLGFGWVCLEKISSEMMISCHLGVVRIFLSQRDSVILRGGCIYFLFVVCFDFCVKVSLKRIEIIMGVLFRFNQLKGIVLETNQMRVHCLVKNETSSL